jgi:hypothetical protein
MNKMRILSDQNSDIVVLNDTPIVWGDFAVCNELPLSCDILRVGNEDPIVWDIPVDMGWACVVVSSDPVALI